MKADPFAQLKLLDVQTLDSRALQVRHQGATMPELGRIEQLQTERSEVAGQAADAQIAVDDLSLAQRKADLDVEAVKSRRERNQQRLDSGAVTNPKDLEALQHELASLAHRIEVLEDEELEVMEQLEQASATLAGFTERLGQIDAELGELGAIRDEKRAGLAAELGQIGQERDLLAADLPTDLLALYDKLRTQYGGIGAAELRARACGGCMLTLDPAELGSIRTTASDVVVRCENCSRILVRTAESGL